MMDANCTRIHNDLSAFIDGELNDAQKAEMETHLSQCSPCAKAHSEQKVLIQVVKDSLAKEPCETPDLWAAIQSQVLDTCKAMTDDLSAYIDGELPVAGQEGVKNHLAGCQSCMDQFRDMSAMNRLLAKGLEVPDAVAVDLWPALKLRLNEDCALIAAEISAFSDREVVTLRHREITAHMLECRTCRNQFNDYARLGDTIREHYKPEKPLEIDLWPEIISKLQIVPFPVKAQEKTGPFTAVASLPRRTQMYIAAAVIGVVGLASSALIVLASSNHIPVSSESYLIESAMLEPASDYEAVVYEEN